MLHWEGQEQQNGLTQTHTCTQYRQQSVLWTSECRQQNWQFNTFSHTEVALQWCAMVARSTPLQPPPPPRSQSYPITQSKYTPTHFMDIGVQTKLIIQYIFSYTEVVPWWGTMNAEIKSSFLRTQSYPMLPLGFWIILNSFVFIAITCSLFFCVCVSFLLLFVCLF